MRYFRIIICLFAVAVLTTCHRVEPDQPEGDSFLPAAGATVYGRVTCGGQGIPGVVVSDGYEVTVTDDRGVYNLKSHKLLKYVFISIPSGYEVLSDGVIPRFFARLNKKADYPERVDFQVTEADQSSYTMLYFGDMHLAARTFARDIEQFREFADDVNGYISSHKGKVYAMTLGDMSWDYFWYANNYDLKNYLSEVNRDFKGLQIFHTMGNHDNDRTFSGDFDGAATYRKVIGPSYYSFNIGDIHYIVLDDIEYLNTPENEGGYRSKVAQEQIDWMVKDIKHVDKHKPVIVTMHSPLYRNDGSSALSNLWDLIKNFEGFDRVQFVTGHTHVVYNVDMLNRSVHVYENNSGAVCGAWWMSGCNYPGLHIGTDGAPGGYRIMDINGTAMSSVYKATGWPESHQFRVYDRNEICLDPQLWLPDASPEDKAEFTRSAGEYARPSRANEILINVWDFDPEWTITVTESGKPLPVTRLTDVRDPLYLVAYEAYEYDNGYSVSYPSSKTDHFFKATATSATSTVEVKVTDGNGRTYTETVARPKTFSPKEYSLK